MSDQIAKATQLDTRRGSKVWEGPWEARDWAARAAGIRSKIPRMGNNINVQKIQYPGVRILSNTVIHFTNVILIGHKIFLASLEIHFFGYQNL